MSLVVVVVGLIHSDFVQITNGNIGSVRSWESYSRSIVSSLCLLVDIRALSLFLSFSSVSLSALTTVSSLLRRVRQLVAWWSSHPQQVI